MKKRSTEASSALRSEKSFHFYVNPGFPDSTSIVPGLRHDEVLARRHWQVRVDSFRVLLIFQSVVHVNLNREHRAVARHRSMHMYRRTKRRVVYRRGHCDLYRKHVDVECLRINCPG